MEVVQKLVLVVSYITTHYQDILMLGLTVLGAFHALLLSMIAFFALIPGAQPEATLQKFADFVGKYSKK